MSSRGCLIDFNNGTMSKLARKREKIGMTRAELADAVGTSYMNIYRYESGLAVPSIKLGLEMAMAMDILDVVEVYDMVKDK